LPTSGSLSQAASNFAEGLLRQRQRTPAPPSTTAQHPPAVVAHPALSDSITVVRKGSERLVPANTCATCGTT
jgi:hypothetical protein